VLDLIFIWSLFFICYDIVYCMLDLMFSSLFLICYDIARVCKASSCWQALCMHRGINEIGKTVCSVLHGLAHVEYCLPLRRVGGARTDIWADFAKTSATNGVSPRDCADTAQHGSADPVLMEIADTVSRRNGYRGKGLFSLCLRVHLVYILRGC